MASNQTTYYGLNQWQPEDKVLREEFNGDNSKVDAALHGLEGTVSTKAAQTEVEGLKTQLATKAAQADLNQVNNQLQGSINNLSTTVASELAKKYGTDNSYIKTGSYTGDEADTRTITVGFQPSLVMIFAMDCDSIDQNYAFLLGNDTAQLAVSVGSRNQICSDWLQLTGSGFTLRMPSISFTHFNSEGCNYRYLAFR